MEGLYREIILDHYKNPRNFGALAKPSAEARDSNQLCGDEIHVMLRIENGIVKKMAYKCVGCAISTASASMLSESVKGKGLDEIRKMDKSSVLKMLNINPGPMRVKCALLPLKAIKLAVYSYLGLKFGGTLENP